MAQLEFHAVCKSYTVEPLLSELNQKWIFWDEIKQNNTFSQKKSKFSILEFDISDRTTLDKSKRACMFRTSNKFSRTFGQTMSAFG